MLTVIGDVIYYNGRAVGIITIPNGTLRGNVEEALTREESSELEELREELDNALCERDEAENKILAVRKIIG